VRLPSTADLHRFCEVDEWKVKKTARGKEAGDHTPYTKTLANGTVLRTKVSHGSKGIGDPDLFLHILRSQLLVSAKQFWDAVDHGTKPQRPGIEPETPPKEAIPFDLARNLLTKVGVSQAELALMSKEQAVARWHEYLSSGGA
jgi:hypothetical protein